MSKKLALIVEDNLGIRRIFVNAANEVGFETIHTENGLEAKRLWLERVPDLVLLDLGLPGIDGESLIAWWLDQRDLPKTKIIVVSLKEFRHSRIEELGIEFWQSIESYSDVDKRLRKVFNELPPYRMDPRDRSLDLTVVPGEKTYISVDKRAQLASHKPLDLDCEVEKGKAEAFLRHRDWQKLARIHGQELYSKLFTTGIEGKYHEAIALSDSPSRLHVCVTVPEACAGTGFELLFDEAPSEFLALKHPLSCRLQGISSRTTPIDRTTLNDLALRGRPLRVLLVGANVSGANSHLPDVALIDKEIEELKVSLPILFGERGIKVEILPPLTSENATVAEFSKRLRGVTCDIVHFSGHAQHDDLLQHECGIYLWSSNDKNRSAHLLGLGEIEDLLKNSKIGFVFVNACWTGASAGSRTLERSRFAGIAHVLLKTGVRSVLGYRIEVSDLRAVQFATHFYQGLADSGELDIALLEARGVLRERTGKTRYGSPPLYIRNTEGRF